MKYYNLRIGSIDQEYIDRISELYDVDYYECDLYIDEKITSASLTNQIIYYILYEAIQALDISERSKEQLQDSIYTNCYDSFYNLSIDDIKNKRDKKIIEAFLNL